MAEHDLERGTRTPGGRGDPSTLKIQVVELLLSWGATAEPADAELLAVVSTLQDRIRFLRSELPDMLRVLLDSGAALLPPELVEDVRTISRSLETGGALRSFSAQDKVEDLLLRADGAVARIADDERASVARELESWAGALDWQELSRQLRLLRQIERPGSVADRLANLGDLRAARAALDSARCTMVSRIESLLPTGAGELEGHEARAIADRALASADPFELRNAIRALEDLRGRRETLTRGTDLVARRARLSDLCRQAREAAGTAGAARARIMLSPIEEAERLLDSRAPLGLPATGSPSADAGSSDPSRTEMDPRGGVHALESWEKALESVIGELEERSAAAAIARTRTAELLRLEIERQAGLRFGTGEEGVVAVPPDIASAAASLVTSASSGSPEAFQAAFDRGLGIVRELDGVTSSNVKEGAAKLRDAAKTLGAFLEKAAVELPTDNVVRARLRLEMVDAYVASGEIAGIEALERSIREDLDAVQRLASAAQRRKQNSAEADRESLRAEASRLMEAATGATGRRLKALREEAAAASPAAMQRLRERIDRAGGTVEQSVRLEAAKVLRSAQRWLMKRAGRGDGAGSDKERSLSGLVESLRSAAAADDLRDLRERTALTRAAFRAISPFARPGLRAAAGAAFALLLGAGFFVWTSSRNRPNAYFLKLAPAPPPSASVMISLVNESGTVFGPKPYSDENGSGLKFELPPGRYEVFLDDRYTGRVIRSGDDPKDVTDIPFTQSSN